MFSQSETHFFPEWKKGEREEDRGFGSHADKLDVNLRPGGGFTAPILKPTKPPKLADHRYGREEMLALYAPQTDIPECLLEHPLICTQQALGPLNLLLDQGDPVWEMEPPTYLKQHPGTFLIGSKPRGRGIFRGDPSDRGRGRGLGRRDDDGRMRHKDLWDDKPHRSQDFSEESSSFSKWSSRGLGRENWRSKDYHYQHHNEEGGMFRRGRYYDETPSWRDSHSESYHQGNDAVHPFKRSIHPFRRSVGDDDDDEFSDRHGWNEKEGREIGVSLSSSATTNEDKFKRPYNLSKVSSETDYHGSLPNAIKSISSSRIPHPLTNKHAPASPPLSSPLGRQESTSSSSPLVPLLSLPLIPSLSSSSSSSLAINGGDGLMSDRSYNQSSLATTTHPTTTATTTQQPTITSLQQDATQQNVKQLNIQQQNTIQQQELPQPYNNIQQGLQQQIKPQELDKEQELNCPPQQPPHRAPLQPEAFMQDSYYLQQQQQWILFQKQQQLLQQQQLLNQNLLSNMAEQQPPPPQQLLPEPQNYQGLLQQHFIMQQKLLQQQHQQHIYPRNCWFYKDPQNDTQGPFKDSDMCEWFKSGYFERSLMLKAGLEGEFVSLDEFIKKVGDLPFAPLPPSPIVTSQQQQHMLSQQQLLLSQQQLLPQETLQHITTQHPQQIPQHSQQIPSINPSIPLQKHTTHADPFLWPPNNANLEKGIKDLNISQPTTPIIWTAGVSTIGTINTHANYSGSVRFGDGSLGSGSSGITGSNSMGVVNTTISSFGDVVAVSGSCSAGSIIDDSVVAKAVGSSGVITASHTAAAAVNTVAVAPTSASTIAKKTPAPSDVWKTFTERQKSVENEVKNRLINHIELEQQLLLEQQRIVEGIKKGVEDGVDGEGWDGDGGVAKDGEVKSGGGKGGEDEENDDSGKVSFVGKEKKKNKKTPNKKQKREIAKLNDVMNEIEEKVRLTEEKGMRAEEMMKELKRKEEELKKQEEELKRKQIEVDNMKQLKEMERAKKMEEKTKITKGRDSDEHDDIQKQQQQQGNKEQQNKKKVDDKKVAWANTEKNKATEQQQQIKQQQIQQQLKQQHQQQQQLLKQQSQQQTKQQEQQKYQEQEQKKPQQKTQQPQKQQAKGNNKTWKSPFTSQLAPKSLLDIQLEQAHQLNETSLPPLTAPTIQQPLQQQQPTWGPKDHYHHQTSSPWDTTAVNKNRVIKESSDFPSLVASKPVQAVSVVREKVEVKVTKVNKQEQNIKSILEEMSSNDTFVQWCIRSVKKTPTNIDMPSLVAILKDVTEQDEAEQYIYGYLGESKVVKNFAKQYLNMREQYSKKQQQEQRQQEPQQQQTIEIDSVYIKKRDTLDNVTTKKHSRYPAKTAIINDDGGKINAATKGNNATASNNNWGVMGGASVGGGKKSRKKMQRLDSKVLGFTVHADPTRTNVGEIDSVPPNHKR